MSALKIYTNESAHVGVAEGLKRRGIDAWSARDAGNLGLSDEEQLNYACREHAVVFTHDADFLRLVHDWTHQAREHWGIIYVHEQKFPVGECVRRLLEYALFYDADDLKNRVEFL